jgi:hypothetical protein
VPKAGHRRDFSSGGRKAQPHSVKNQSFDGNREAGPPRQKNLSKGENA